MVALRKVTKRQRCSSLFDAHGRTKRISIELEAALVKVQVVAERIDQFYIRCVRLDT